MRKMFNVSLVDKENPGVLILSPFAGAGDTMHEALRVNPYELGNGAQVKMILYFLLPNIS